METKKRRLEKHHGVSSEFGLQVWMTSHVESPFSRDELIKYRK